MINLTALKNRSRLVKYPQGTMLDDAVMRVLFEGEAGIISGRPGEHLVVKQRLKPGDFFCEGALFLQSGEPVKVVALTDIVVLPLPGDGAISFFSEEPAFAFELCRAMYERLHGCDTAVVSAEQTAPENNVQPEPAGGKMHAQAEDKPRAAAADVEPQANQAAAQPQPAVTAPQQTGSLTPGPKPDAHAQSGVFPLFPEGHGVCSLPMLNNADREHLYKRSVACPLCGKKFEHLAVRTSRLVLKSTDSDMRPRYKDVEPLYYEVITCPHCLYSALHDVFDKPEKPKAEFLKQLTAIKESCSLRFGEEGNADSVFAGYYLAVLCAQHCFPKPQMVAGKLYTKLSRIYQDAGNSKMEMQAAQQALDSYMYAYQNIKIPESQEQQLCLMIAELYLKLEQLREAKDFFFKVKVFRNGAPRLKRQAENRLFEIRESGG